MHLTRTLRMMRWAPLAAFAAVAACEHGDLNSVVMLDGDSVIANVSLSAPTSGAAAASPLGTRVVNRFKISNFDTTRADAFARSSANPANYRPDPSGCYGAAPLIHFASTAVSTFTPPNRYLPALVSSAAGLFARNRDVGCGIATAYVVPGNNPGNGNAPMWEFWIELGQTPANVRYVMGLARYAVQVRGELDQAALLLGDPIIQKDTLVFRAGDFTPGGPKGAAEFTTSCANAAMLFPVAGANPHFLGSALAGGNNAHWDASVCSAAGQAWFNGLGDVTSPVGPNNNTALGANQYNFLVVWEALADSTPDYAKPIWRQQIAPLMTTAGVVINNSYAPVPAAALTPAQIFASAGGTAAFLAPDSVTLTMSNLDMLATGNRYEVWLTESGTANARLVTGRVNHLIGGVIVDSNLAATSFDGDQRVGVTTTFKYDFGNYVNLGNYNAVVVGIGTGSGGTALPAAQPLWSSNVGKVLPGQTAPTLSANVAFGQFDNGGANLRLWGPNGQGIGGAFGFNLDIQLNHLPRPPVGYYYNAYLRNNADTVAPRDLGPVTSPWPDYASLRDADLNEAGTVNSHEIVQSSLRVVGTSATEFCAYDKIDVRLALKSGATTQPATAIQLPPTITLSGANPWYGSARCP